ncbi:hypothetical protein FB593_102562 [Rhizobium sp. SJZ105]|nr:hypothetical protein FB593_102562 [Rhizobium sp. SJZ105]
MPIADMAGYEKGHWLRVREVLDQSIEAANYVPRLVSESEDTGIIHANIVQNLYDDPIVVCDVSGKNANVMFELGLRLAFDKPTIIVKDDKTDYSFDTSPIKHIPYRADLRFDNVREFQEAVAKAVAATVEKKKSDPDYSPFLKHFHRVKITELQTEEVGSQQFIIDQIQGVQKEISKLTASVAALSTGVPAKKHDASLNLFALGLGDSTMSKARRMATDAAIGLAHYDPENKDILG